MGLTWDLYGSYMGFITDPQKNIFSNFFPLLFGIINDFYYLCSYFNKDDK